MTAATIALFANMGWWISFMVWGNQPARVIGCVGSIVTAFGIYGVVS